MTCVIKEVAVEVPTSLLEETEARYGAERISYFLLFFLGLKVSLIQQVLASFLCVSPSFSSFFL